MLVNNLSIKQVKEKPIVLQWFESSASHASHNEYGTNQGQSSISKIYANACNVSEVCDDNEGETITHSQNNIINNGSTHTRPASIIISFGPKYSNKFVNFE
jgi:hypothetical protein